MKVIMWQYDLLNYNTVLSYWLNFDDHMITVKLYIIIMQVGLIAAVSLKDTKITLAKEHTFRLAAADDERRSTCDVMVFAVKC